MKTRGIVSAFLLAISVPIASNADGQQRKTDPCRPLPRADSTRDPGIYPIGDAVGVYRAVLDLLYRDGGQRPSVIVMHDSVQYHSEGPGPVPCHRGLPHKSAIDAATMLSFARFDPNRPRIVDFGYDIPIVFTSDDDLERMRHDGYAYLATHPPAMNDAVEPFWTEFALKYPGAWGWLTLTKVAFNGAHTEALVQAVQTCGDHCVSDEILFLKRIDDRWEVVERIPKSAEVEANRGNLRYRGPAGAMPSQSELLRPSESTRSFSRDQSRDEASVFRAVLDSLYAFHGESPRRIVLTNYFRMTPAPFPQHKSAIDSTALAKFEFLSSVRVPPDPAFSYRLPISILTRDSVSVLKKIGAPLEKRAQELLQDASAPPAFWLAFRQRYPDAWGMVGFTRVAFNLPHTQALVFADHQCGDYCHSGDAWFVERTGETWRIAERIPGEKQDVRALDSLRYLAVDADPKLDRERRAHGVFTNAVTGWPIANLKVTVQFGRHSEVMTTDSLGRYLLARLPLYANVGLKTSCSSEAKRDSIGLVGFFVTPGLDTTINYRIDFRQCIRNPRGRPLIAGAKESPAVGSSNYPPEEEAAVYRAVLDAFYPTGSPVRGPIMINGFTHLPCLDCFDAEIPRLIRNGAIDPTTETNFANAPKDTLALRPTFGYRRTVHVFSRDERNFIEEQALRGRAYFPPYPQFWDVMKDAYPGVNMILSFSRVGFNDKHTEALVEVYPDSSQAMERPEMMLLRKTANAWRVALRHVEHESTSGAVIAGKCEVVDAPERRPTVGEIEHLIGDFTLMSVGTSREGRGYGRTVLVRLQATDTLARYYIRNGPNSWVRRTNGEIPLTGRIIDRATGRPKKGMQAYLFMSGPRAELVLTDDPRADDGWGEEYAIRRVSGKEFFGGWLTASGHSRATKGYFCAAPAPTH